MNNNIEPDKLISPQLDGQLDQIKQPFSSGSLPQAPAETLPVGKISPEELKSTFFYGAGCLFELTKGIVLFIILLTLLHSFIATIFIVDGISMEPNYHTGEYVIANRWQYIFGEPKRGDSVILRYPGDPANKKYIKRIVALPGEKIKLENSEFYINGKVLKEDYIPADIYTDAEAPVDRVLAKNEYYTVGDNRPNSNDSRVWGPAERRFLIGKAWIKIWPKIEMIKEEKY